MKALSQQILSYRTSLSTLFLNNRAVIAQLKLCDHSTALRSAVLLLLYVCSTATWAQGEGAMISGKILSGDRSVVSDAIVYLKDVNQADQMGQADQTDQANQADQADQTVHESRANYRGRTNQEGIYHVNAPAGDYILVVSAEGYQAFEKQVKLAAGKRTRLNIMITSTEATQLGPVVVTANNVSRVKRSAFNAIAIDTRAMENSTQNLSDALARAPGLKIRESGGVGSDMQLMMDGFNGRHIKIFIDGVPQEGVGSSFGLNNIPVNYAERIEVYKGVVPVGFATDAIGGVINIVTKQNARREWFLDASYSYGSFNTHKSYINFGQTFRNGLTYELSAFQNYSDNTYTVNTPVKDFATGVIDQSQRENVRRFNDTYHNEAVNGKVGIINKSWADRLMFSLTYSRMHKDIQTGVRQDIVFGGKYNKGYSVMPSVEYRKRNVLTRGLDVMMTANYNKNISNNVDTSAYEFNWRGELRPLRNGARGEQSYQDTRSDNNNWNGTATVNYRIGRAHSFVFNHVINDFKRNNRSMLNRNGAENAIPKITTKNISGLSYRLMPSEHWNFSVFGKYYDQSVSGPMAVTSAQDQFMRQTNSINATGYGLAGTYFLLDGLQAKVSYEKAYRLPTNDEMFGDEDMESGKLELKPESSNNLNLNLSYNKVLGSHSVYVEGGVIYRDTRDYIQRNIESLGSGRFGAAYSNHGRVETKGYNLSARYGFSHWVSLGGNFTQTDTRDKVKTISSTTSQASLTYGSRMPNVPYRFSNADVTFYWRDFGKKSNLLTMTYDNLHMHSFPLYSEAIGSESKFVVPTQFAHNLTVSYSIKNGRYNMSFECRNITDEKLYDNFSLQKAGRAFYGKFRVYFGG